MQRALYLMMLVLGPLTVFADAPDYQAIAAQHPAARLDATARDRARGEGHCLAGIKAINSLPRQQFHPNIEWLRLRTGALLSHMTPCEVLVMLEAAHDALDTQNAPKNREK